MTTPPDVPGAFWGAPELRAALASQHMGHVIRAYRRHRHHGREPLPQEQVAGWAGLTQGQLSRIETGPPMVHLDKLIHWARLLRIPPRHLWFALPGPPAPGRDDERDRAHDTDGRAAVRRGNFLALTGAALAGAVTGLAAPAGSASAAVTAKDLQQVGQHLAWELWSAGVPAIDSRDLPAALAHHLQAAYRSRGGLGGLVVRDGDGRWSFAHPALLDLFLAQRIFGEIMDGDSHLFATAQTSHGTDLVIRQYAAAQPEAVSHLSRWMLSGHSAVLRVNAAGVLAKLADPAGGDRVIDALRADPDSRHRYLSAVLARVAHLGWDEAAQLASQMVSGGRVAPDRAAGLALQLSAELHHGTDHAARWFSALALCGLVSDVSGVSGVSGIVEPALRAALAVEPCREILRTIGTGLAGGGFTGG